MINGLETYSLIDLVLKLGSLVSLDLKLVHFARKVRDQSRVLVELRLGHCEIILALLSSVLSSQASPT